MMKKNRFSWFKSGDLSYRWFKSPDLNQYLHVSRRVIAAIRTSEDVPKMVQVWRLVPATALSLIFVLLSCVQGLISAQTPLQIAQQAQKAYQQSRYDDAVSAYEKLIQSGYHDADLCYNLGNACFRAGKLGKAVLYYEKALSLDPTDEATLANLEQVRSELTDQIDHSAAPEWWDWFLQPQWIMRPNTWAVTFAILIWLGMGLFWYIRRKSAAHWMPWAARGLLVLAFFVLLAAALSYWHDHQNPNGVILSKEATLRIGPEQASPAIRTLHEGTKVAYLDKIGSWDKVRLANGQEGWLEGKSTGRIR